MVEILAIPTMEVTTAVMLQPISLLYHHRLMTTAINLLVRLALRVVETTEIVMVVAMAVERHRRLPRCLPLYSLLKDLLLLRNKWILLGTMEVGAGVAMKVKNETTTIIVARAVGAMTAEHRLDGMMATAVGTEEAMMMGGEEEADKET